MPLASKPFAIAALAMAAVPAAAQDLSFGLDIGVETLSFADDTTFDDTTRLVLGVNIDGTLAPGLDMALNLSAWTDDIGDTARIDPLDAWLRWTSGSFEALLGYEIENWSVTEASELTNIINQSDLERDITGSTRLAQPMLRLSYLSNIGWFGLYYFPQSPERRFDPIFGLDGIEPIYDTDRKDKEPGAALRYQHNIGVFDLGAFVYRGLDKSPSPVLVAGLPRLRYPVVTQTGLSAQALLGDTYLRGELLHVAGRADRDGDTRDSLAYSFEVENQTYGVFGMDADLSLLMAYTGNSLGRDSTDIFQDDISLGAKLNWNNVGSTEVSLLVNHDMTYGSSFGTLSFETRLRDNLKLELDFVDFFDVDGRDTLSPLAQARHAKLQLTLSF